MTDTSLKCEICRKHDVSRKDYRFIDSCGLQGKVLDCEWCYNLSDVAVSEVIRDGLDSKDFYEKEEIDLFNQERSYEKERDNKMKLETELKIITNEMRSALAILEDSSVRVGLTKKDWDKIEDELERIHEAMKYLVEKIEDNKKKLHEYDENHHSSVHHGVDNIQ